MMAAGCAVQSSFRRVLLVPPVGRNLNQYACSVSEAAFNRVTAPRERVRKVGDRKNEAMVSCLATRATSL